MTSNPSFKDYIVYEDDSIIVLNKPHGLLVTEDRYNKEKPCLKNILSEFYRKIFIVHRLDKGTGGLIVFAKNKDAHRSLCISFEKGEVKKEYIALVKGEFGCPVTCMLPVSSRPQKGKYKINFRSGKKAVTSFYPVEKRPKISMVKAEMHTGRTHQIRLHLKSLGHPLFQDFLYNEKNADKRLTLFCSALAFEHPVKREPVEFSSALSDFMLSFYKARL